MTLTHDEISSLLSRAPLFSHLDGRWIERLAPLFHTVTCSAGEIIFSAGDPSEEMFIIASGQVCLDGIQDDPGSHIWRLKQGDILGEEALLLDDPRAYGAVAQTDVLLIRLAVDDYLQLATEPPGVEAMLEVIVRSRKLAAHTPLAWLGEDEFVYVLARRHPALLFFRLVIPVGVGIVVALLSILLLWMWLPGRPLGWVTLGVGLPLTLIWTIWTTIDWHNDLFALTNLRVVWVEKVALSYASRREAPLRTMMSVGVQASRIGSWLGFADVVVRTYVGTMLLTDLAYADSIATLIESYWQRAKERDREEEARAMERKLREKLALAQSDNADLQLPDSESDQSRITQTEDDPGFFRWLSAGILRLRTQKNGTITYRKHWLLLVRDAWLPVLLMGASIGAMVIRLSGRFQFLPITGSLAGLIIILFFLFLWVLYAYVDWQNDVFALTYDQIIDVDRKPFGKISRRTAPLENILSVESERRGLWGLIFNYGTVFISVGSEQLTFDYVYNPTQVQQDIFFRMGERLEEIHRHEIESERERISDWIASYHRNIKQSRDETQPS